MPDGGGQVLALSVLERKLSKCNQRCPDIRRVWGTWVRVIHLNTQGIGSYGVSLVSSSPKLSAQIQAETSSHPGWLKTPVGLKTNENLPQVQREVFAFSICITKINTKPSDSLICKSANPFLAQGMPWSLRLQGFNSFSRLMKRPDFIRSSFGHRQHTQNVQALSICPSQRSKVGWKMLEKQNPKVIDSLTLPSKNTKNTDHPPPSRCWWQCASMLPWQVHTHLLPHHGSSLYNIFPGRVNRDVVTTSTVYDRGWNSPWEWVRAYRMQPGHGTSWKHSWYDNFPPEDNKRKQTANQVVFRSSNEANHHVGMLACHGTS